MYSLEPQFWSLHHDDGSRYRPTPNCYCNKVYHFGWWCGQDSARLPYLKLSQECCMSRQAVLKHACLDFRWRCVIHLVHYCEMIICWPVSESDLSFAYAGLVFLSHYPTKSQTSWLNQYKPSLYCYFPSNSVFSHGYCCAAPGPAELHYVSYAKRPNRRQWVG